MPCHHQLILVVLLISGSCEVVRKKTNLEKHWIGLVVFMHLHTYIPETRDSYCFSQTREEPETRSITILVTPAAVVKNCFYQGILTGTQ